jgi:hypothetical protein
MNSTATRTRKLALCSAYVVAAIAGVESYSHIVAVTAAHGQGVIMSHLYPFSIDGVVLVGTLALAARRRNLMAWVAVIAGVVATLAANVAAAEPTLIGRAISAWPAVAFLISTEIVLKGASRAAEIAATAPAAADTALAARRSESARKAAATRRLNAAKAASPAAKAAATRRARREGRSA